jgi:hypothetical protein
METADRRSGSRTTPPVTTSARCCGRTRPRSPLLARASPPSTQHACTTSHANVNASHSAARGAVHGASDGTDSAMVASGRSLAGRAQRVAILEQERVLRDDTPARAPMHGAPSLQLGNSRIPNSSASAAMQSCPGSPTDRHRRRRCRHRSGLSACARQHGSAPPEQARSHHRPQAIVLRKGPKARQCCVVMNGSTAFEAGAGCCRQGPSGQPSSSQD